MLTVFALGMLLGMAAGGVAGTTGVGRWARRHFTMRKVENHWRGKTSPRSLRTAEARYYFQVGYLGDWDGEVGYLLLTEHEIDECRHRALRNAEDIERTAG